MDDPIDEDNDSQDDPPPSGSATEAGCLWSAAVFFGSFLVLMVVERPNNIGPDPMRGVASTVAVLALFAGFYFLLRTIAGE